MNDAPYDHFTVASILIPLGIGVSVTLIAWQIANSVAVVPDEDRTYKDPPPLAFRLVWVLVRWLGYYLDPLVSPKFRDALHARLRQAGLEYAIDASQFIAGRLVCGLAMACIFAAISVSFTQLRASHDGSLFNLFAQAAVIALLGSLYPAIWLRDRIQARRREMLRTLPFCLDIITLCVEAGLNMQGAMTQAVNKGPKGTLRDEFQRVLRDMRAGKGRAAALREMAGRLNEPSITSFTTAVIQAENMGMSLGPVLRAQADQRRTERFLRAEKLAMEAPVKMLFPLIAFIFPCTFIVLFFPIVMKFIDSGL